MNREPVVQVMGVAVAVGFGVTVILAVGSAVTPTVGVFPLRELGGLPEYPAVEGAEDLAVSVAAVA